ncbi:MAG: LacI family transcriptional regulator [Oscillibacter sp.]|nr:LacI family transcriptional regulator [Oscillibacter sp.]
MAVTIRDVAALAGVSPSTVSRVCNDSPSISRETKEKVRKAMAQLSYEPAPPSGGAAKTRFIGVILPPSPQLAYENPFFLETLRGISQFCNQRQYAPVVITGRDEEEILAVLRGMSQDGCLEGAVLMYSKAEDHIVDCLCDAGLLYVLIGKPSQLASQTVCVDNDNLLAGREATDYLYSLGHRRIAYLGCDSVFFFSADRKSGYQLSMLQHGLPVLPGCCVEVEALSDTTALRALLEQEERPTAVVAGDDILAVALERTCIQMGLSVPEDVSIISFNNSPFAQFTSFQLTSVDVNSFQLGFEAASQLINHVENPNLLATKIIVPHYIVERNSCRRLEAQ